MTREVRRPLTRAQVLRWRGEKWSRTDRRAIEQSLDLLPADRVEFYEELATTRVFAAVDGIPAFIIRPGFVSWPKGQWADGVDDSLFAGRIRTGGEGDGTLWAALSTFQSYSRTHKNAQVDRGTCSTCYQPILATGSCGYCE
jgi:hypothetical protein